ncbi:dihydroorotate dehydrogenase [Liquorilactobacillus mali]|uniref:Dihydroorotate dehydrogenase n=2 Tax=Liquorilactobacillus mali TaxID=1618 RepID=J1F4Y6_9LACO|nr:dihydroorotate dehydrogenase [Liquorilactobacillus mali]EJF01012.1 dihydroorotate dehydrogenase 1B [Liquorilactobacillus mali KCTC 3596 = DSM 20444]KRN09196.1 dihydroorotate dehydrogenase 1B [Liquorilactobacillus mali KCTC 3596 = DSM 20444]KRN33039.1 dihydroorotate dehydrogenase 1B [Liquorilactobacillus mali]QFQ74377.1 dihydroorotate dehydrogenase [Liquorilactobacillus mali]
MKNSRLAVSLPGLELKNPVMPSSGCFGFGDNKFAQMYDLNKLGSIILKSATLNERKGNPEPRIAVVEDGALNAVGLKNPGLSVILSQKIPELRAKVPDLPLIASVAGSTKSEYVEVAKALSASGLVNALELNISCPNVHEGGMLFGTSPKIAAELTRAVKEVTDIPVFVKLTPNVTDIVEIAKAVAAAGADGLSMINTSLGMKIDIKTRKPVLGNGTGGLSGRAIKPLAVRMIYQVSHAIDLPIIASGGIENVDDVIEMYLAGAHAVSIGTAHFKNPTACLDLIEELPAKLDELGITSLKSLIEEVRSNR